MRSEYRLKYDAKTEQVYKIWVVTILLSILTLGIYRFWGKTRLRKYTTAGFALYSLQDAEYIGEDRFEYTGTGGELFNGFLKALIFLMIFSIPFFWASWEMNKINDAALKEHIQKTEQLEQLEQVEQLEYLIREDGSLEKSQTTPQSSVSDSYEVMIEDIQINSAYFYLVISVFLFYLILYIAFFPFVAIFQSLKYRTSRLRFRSIRAHLDGSSIKYGLFGLLHTFLTIVTIGLWKPFADLSLHKYKMKRLYFGNQIFQFKAPYIKLFFNYLLWYLLFVIGAVLFVYGNILTAAPPELIEEIEAIINNDNLFNFLLTWSPFLGGFFLLISLIGLFFGYRAALGRAKYNCLTLNNIGFKFDITGYNLFKLKIGNIFIILFTLGIGIPWAMQRNQRFLAKNLKIVGNIGQLEILRAPGQEDTSGEGLLSFFDLQIKMF